MTAGGTVREPVEKEAKDRRQQKAVYRIFT